MVVQFSLYYSVAQVINLVNLRRRNMAWEAAAYYTRTRRLRALIRARTRTRIGMGVDVDQDLD